MAISSTERIRARPHLVKIPRASPKRPLAQSQGMMTFTESDLRCYLAWCAERGLDPLAAQRPHLELYIRWMQEIRRFKPLDCLPAVLHVRLPGAFDPPLNLVQAVAERNYAPPYLSLEQRLPSQLRPLVIVNCGRAGSSA
jgi:hypothetical protein